MKKEDVPIFPRQIDSYRLMAETFVKRIKGRLPGNADELIEWLLEFNKIEIQMGMEWERLLKEHLDLCTSPRIITKDFR